MTCNENGSGAILEATLIDLPGAEKTFVWTYEGRPFDVSQNSTSIVISETGWYKVQVDVELPEIRKRNTQSQSTRTIWFGGCDTLT